MDFLHGFLTGFGVMFFFFVVFVYFKVKVDKAQLEVNASIRDKAPGQPLHWPPPLPNG